MFEVFVHAIHTHLNFNNGSSTVDYAICNKTAYNLIDNFYVKPINELSDHSKIVTVLKDPGPNLETDREDNYNWKARGKLYIWDGKSKQNVINKLKSSVKEIDEISY